MAVWRCLRHLGKGVEHQHCPRWALVCAGPFDRLVWWPTVLAIFLATCIAGFFSAYGRIPAVVSLIHHQLHDLSSRVANLLTTLEIEQGNREGGLSPNANTGPAAPGDLEGGLVLSTCNYPQHLLLQPLHID